MAKKKIKVILDFDGNLTDETKQAAELVDVAKKMLSEILGCSARQIDKRYQTIKGKILAKPQRYSWEINGLPACYAYEGAYLLNTAILQQILKSEPRFMKIITKRFPAAELDSVTQCVNQLFHQGSFSVNPHFLPGAREFLLGLLAHPKIEPVILTNSETRKIAKNLAELSIGEKGTDHPFEHEIGILGDTRQYFMKPDWPVNFTHEKHGPIQVLPINKRFQVELRRPIYYEALKKVIADGFHEIVVVADGFSLAGALPLMMGLSFILMKTGYTPAWCTKYVGNHPKGQVVSDIPGMHQAVLSLLPV